jgi:hypothetical protein
LVSSLSEKLDERVRACKAEKQANHLALTQRPEDQCRQNVRDNFFQALMLAFTEAKDSLPAPEEEPKLNSLAIRLEAALFAHHRRACGKEYTKKFRMLQSTLQAQDNK